MRLRVAFTSVLGGCVIVAWLVACGESSNQVPGASTATLTPRSTLTVFAIPSAFETRTPRTQNPPTSSPALSFTPSPPATSSIQGESPGRSIVASHGGPVKDYVSLIDNLRQSGVTVSPAGEISQPFFSIKGFKVMINNSEVQVFEYPDTGAATAEAALVSPAGSPIGTSMVSWIEPPHFYHKERLIVLYVGSDVIINNLLIQALGPQFAGK